MSSDISNQGIKSSAELRLTNEQVTCKEIKVEAECNNTICGNCATAIGCSTKAFGDCSIAEGTGTKAYGYAAHSEGNNTTANGDNSHAEGCSTVAFGNCSHTEGSYTNTYADSSHAEGYYSKARGSYSHAEGYNTNTANTFAHAEGYNTQANGYASHTEGSNTTAKLDYSHAEGYNTSANNYYSHTEGYTTKADGYAAHAEGYNTSANGSYTHAEGYNSSANGAYSHAEGDNTIANASYSHAEGYYTNTKNATGSHIMGIYGDADTPFSWFLGGGTSDTDRSLAAKILYTGDAYIRNAWNAGGSGFAELFKSQCQTIEAGYFVTLYDDNVQLVHCREDYILGVTTSAPGFVANSVGLKKTTIGLAKQGLDSTTDLILPEVKDHEGKVLAPEQSVKVAEPNKNSENMKSAVQYSDEGTYWISVVLMGQVVVYDDGTCKPNQYCLPNENGIATEAKEGYRVMKRLCDNQIVIMFR